MLSYPRVGQAVELRYRPALRGVSGLHGAVGVVVAVASGRRCRNHGVMVGGRLAIVPAGQLFKVEGEGDR